MTKLFSPNIDKSTEGLDSFLGHVETAPGVFEARQASADDVAARLLGSSALTSLSDRVTAPEGAVADIPDVQADTAEALANSQAALDTVNAGIKPDKAAVRVLATATVTIASDLQDGDTLDGVTLATGDRVAQTDAANQAIYDMTGGASNSQALTENTGRVIAPETINIGGGASGVKKGFGNVALAMVLDHYATSDERAAIYNFYKPIFTSLGLAI